MEPKAHLTSAYPVAGTGLAVERDPVIFRVTSTMEDEGRFLPGTLLGECYRILSLLGRRGFFRALTLRKLPEEASHNQRIPDRFHGEVRVARLESCPTRLPLLRLPADKAVQTVRKQSLERAIPAARPPALRKATAFRTRGPPIRPAGLLPH